MPEPTPAEELRAAAATLREHARDATKEPWWAEDTTPAYWGDERDAKVACADGTLAVLCPEWNGPFNAAWMALMGPGMGPLLADWLEWMVRAEHGASIAIPTEALAVARKINAKTKEQR